MKYSLIVDSCCDATGEILPDMNLVKVPLNLMLGEREIVDDEGLNLSDFMEDMKNCNEKIGSSAPAPYLYSQAYEQAESSFVVTLSSRLSSSYSSAILGQQMLDNENHEVYVFDSKSASAGEALLALKIREFIVAGMSRDEIIEKGEAFIKRMKTYFVLDNIDNLMKNGRLSKIKGRLINMLNIKPLLGSDGDGQIVSYANCKGTAKIIKKMVETIELSGIETSGETLVISHCNNIELATRLKMAIEESYQFKQIYVIATGGLSSLYANDKGIVMAF